MKKEYRDWTEWKIDRDNDAIEYYKSLSSHELMANLVFELNRFNENYEYIHPETVELPQQIFKDKVESGKIKLKK